MLQLIRSKVSSIFIKALFALLVVSFAIWGIGDIFLGGSGGRAAVTVGETVFSSAEVLNEFDRTRRAMRLQPQQDEMMRPHILDSVIESLVETGLFEAEGRMLGLIVGEDQIKSWVRDAPAFRDELGRFSPEMFRQTLFNAGVGEEEFFRSLDNDLKRLQITSAVQDTAIVPESLVKTLFDWRSERRIADGVFIPIGSIEGVPEPEPAQLHDYFERNKADYVAPEYRDATYVALSADELAREVLVPEDELRTEYEQRIDEFTRPETRSLAQFIFPDEAAARAASATAGAAAGTDAAIAALAGRGGEPVMLDDVTRDTLVDDAERAAAFDTVTGRASNPVETPFGWKVFVVRSAEPEHVQSFEDARQGIRDAIAHDRALDAMFELANSLEDALAGGATIEEAARSIHLTARSSGEVDLNGLRSDGTPMEDLVGSRLFLQTLFETEADAQSPLVETPEGGYFLLRVDAVVAERQRDLSEVRDLASRSWKNAQRLDRAEQRAAFLVDSARGGVGLEAAAMSAGYAASRIGPVTRNGTGLDRSAWPPAVVGTIFDLSRNDLGISVAGTGVAVVELLEIGSSARSDDEAEWTRVSEELATALAQDYQEAYVRNLRERHPVTIDRAYIDTLMAASQ